MIVLIVALVVAVLALSGATLASDATALARVSVGPLGGTIERVQAFGPAGRPVPLAVSGGRLTPLTRLHPGEQVSVDVTVRRPGWIGWALGHTRTEHLALLAPIAQVSEHWMTVSPGAPVQVSFDGPVSAVAYGSTGNLTQHTLGGAQRSISLGTQPATGAVAIAAAPRPWETLGAPDAGELVSAVERSRDGQPARGGLAHRPRHAALFDVLKARQRSARLRAPADRAEHAGTVA